MNNPAQLRNQVGGKGDRFIYWVTLRFWPITALPERLLSADSVEKVGRGFKAEKYASEIEILNVRRTF